MTKAPTLSKDALAKLQKATGDFKPEITQPEGYQLIKIHEIAPSPHNRKHFDPGQLADLEQSIRTSGLLQPIVVRSVMNADMHGKLTPKGKYETHEIIAGERRWKACIGAGLQIIPAIVKNLDDRQAAEAMAVENLQREDLRPLDEARAYKHLISVGFTAGEVADRVHVSRSVVFARLKLLDLPPHAKAAVDETRLPVSHAELVMRLFDPELQEAFAKDILHCENDWHLGDGEIMSFRHAKQLLEKYQQKESNKLKWIQAKGDAEANGNKILSAAIAEKVFGKFGHADSESAYVPLDNYAPNYEGQWSKLIPKKMRPEMVLAQNPITLEPVELYCRAELLEILKKKKGQSGPAKKEISPEAKRAKEVRENRKQHQEIIARVVRAIEIKGDTAEFWGLWCELFIGRTASSDAARVALQRRYPDQKIISGQTNTLLMERALTMTAVQVRALCAELLITGATWPSTWDSSNELRVKEWAKHFGIQDQDLDQEDVKI